MDDSTDGGLTQFLEIFAVIPCAKRIEHSENKVIAQSRLFENEIDLDCISPAFDKHSRCKITKT